VPESNLDNNVSSQDIPFFSYYLVPGYEGDYYNYFESLIVSTNNSYWKVHHDGYTIIRINNPYGEIIYFRGTNPWYTYPNLSSESNILLDNIFFYILKADTVIYIEKHNEDPTFAPVYLYYQLTQDLHLNFSSIVNNFDSYKLALHSYILANQL
jgi:hypothetical protein